MSDLQLAPQHAWRGVRLTWMVLLVCGCAVDGTQATRTAADLDAQQGSSLATGPSTLRLGRHPAQVSEDEADEGSARFLPASSAQKAVQGLRGRLFPRSVEPEPCPLEEQPADRSTARREPAAPGAASSSQEPRTAAAEPSTPEALDTPETLDTPEALDSVGHEPAVPPAREGPHEPGSLSLSIGALRLTSLAEELPSVAVDETVTSAPRPPEPAGFQVAAARRPGPLMGDELLLTAAQCQCQAAAHSPMAAALDREREAVRRQGEGCGKKKLQPAIALHTALLHCRSLHERNRSAEQALTAFYQLAEVRAQEQVLGNTQSDLDRMIESLKRLAAAGVQSDVDRSDADRRNLAAARQRAELLYGGRRLSLSLNLLLGRGRHASAPQPWCQLAANRDDVDLEQAMADGVACRPDLNALRIAIRCLDRDTLEPARGAMSRLEPSLGAVISADCQCFRCLKSLIPDCDKQSCEVQDRRRQLQQLYQAAKERAEGEISDAAYQVLQRLEVLRVAEQTWESWDLRVRQLEAQRQAQSGLYVELLEARFARLSARAAVIREQAGLELDRVQLAATQGILARQCGYGCCGDAHCHVAPLERSTPTLQGTPVETTPTSAYTDPAYIDPYDAPREPDEDALIDDLLTR